MPKRNPKLKPAKSAAKRRKGASPLNGIVPPPEHRFQPGNTASVGHGRPRKLADLQELIKDTLAEETSATLPDGQRVTLTRAQAMIRTMLIKSPTDRIALLEYAFGKIANIHEIIDWRAEAHKAGYDPEELYNRLIAAGRAAVDAGSDRRSGPDGHSDSGPAVDTVPTDAPSQAD